MTTIKDKENNFEIVKQGNAPMLEVTVSDPNERDKAGQTLLHAAVQCWEEDVIRLLLNKKADVNARTLETTKQTPLHYAAASCPASIVKILLDGLV